jgi:hypothetical protein
MPISVKPRLIVIGVADTVSGLFEGSRGSIDFLLLCFHPKSLKILLWFAAAGIP